MKLNNKLVRILLLTFVFVMIFSITAGAIVPYTTYTYGLNGKMQRSPDAYVPLMTVDSNYILNSYYNGASAITQEKYSFDKILGLLDPSDIFVDDLNHVYIADTGNKRVIGLDENYNIRVILKEFTNNQGVPDALSNPQGVFVTQNEIYVADTDKSRIVIFDKTGKFVDIVAEPTSDVMPENSVYKPIAVAVDEAGRIYVVSSMTNYGIISLNRNGTFNGFIGPQRTSGSPLKKFFDKFKTAEQKKQEVSVVSTEFNNLTIDADGFIYATISSIDEGLVASSITGKDRSGKYAPVKKLNPNGSDVMNRNGIWPPSGEVDMYSFSSVEQQITGPSKVVDVALGPNGTWSIIDQKRSKIFTYDSNGNLLYAFGDMGDQKGNIQNLVGIAFQGTRILLLDKASSSFTIYKRTDYGSLIDSAIRSTEDKKYDEARSFNTKIVQRNNNFDTAFVGIGQSLYREGKYVEALSYFRSANDSANYSIAYKAFRKEWMESYFIFIVVGIVLVCVGIAMFFKFANKYNRKMQRAENKQTFVSEIMYGFHVIFHPFDGFWDIKHEKRGSVRGATFWLGITVLTFIYKTLGSGYLAGGGSSGGSFIMMISSVVLPLFLWVTANWCLTTLFEGEGSYKDVYIASCYSLIPVPLLMIPSTIFSNFIDLEQIKIISSLQSLAFFWLGLLIFFAMMVIHDYTLGKNILTTLGTIVGAAFIMFVGVLFSTLIIKVFKFGYNIFIELKYRYWA